MGSEILLRTFSLFLFLNQRINWWTNYWKNKLVADWSLHITISCSPKTNIYICFVSVGTTKKTAKIGAKCEQRHAESLFSTCDPLVFKDVPVDALYYLPMDRLIHYQPPCGASEILVLGQLCVQRHHSGQWAIAREWQARKMSPLFRLYKWRLATITHNWTLHFKSGASWPVKSYYTIFFICGPWFW